MNKGKFFFYAGSAFLFILALAYVFDGSRQLQNAQAEVAKADQELKKIEGKLIAALASLPEQSSELKMALVQYNSAKGIKDRRERYQLLVAEVGRNSAKQVDVNNTLLRRFADEIAGAINRREIAERYFQERLDICETIRKSQSAQLAIELGLASDQCES